MAQVTSEHNRVFAPKSWTIGPRWSLGNQAKLFDITSVWEGQLHPNLLLTEHVSNTATAKEAADHVTLPLLVPNDGAKGGRL